MILIQLIKAIYHNNPSIEVCPDLVYQDAIMKSQLFIRIECNCMSMSRRALRSVDPMSRRPGQADFQRLNIIASAFEVL